MLHRMLTVLALTAIVTASPLIVGCTALETTTTPQKTDYVSSTALAKTHMDESKLLGSVATVTSFCY